jgi:hypothetical protein
MRISWSAPAPDQGPVASNKKGALRDRSAPFSVPDALRLEQKRFCSRILGGRVIEPVNRFPLHLITR